MEAIIAFIQTKNFNLKLGKKQITVSIYLESNLIHILTATITTTTTPTTLTTTTTI